MDAKLDAFKCIKPRSEFHKYLNMSLLYFKRVLGILSMPYGRIMILQLQPELLGILFGIKKLIWMGDIKGL